MVTIDPAYVAPGEVWLVDAPAGRAGVWVGMRPGLDNGVWWRLVRVGGDGIVYLRDDDVRLLDQLVPASREAAERDRDLLRRAHSIVERERDQAREQRAVAERERNDLRRQVEDLTERRQNLVRERDLDAKLAKCMSDFQDMEDECDMWRARAEAAEARTAPAVTKRELRSVVAAHDPGDDELAVSRVNALTDRLWSLVSGADPAVHVVRESEVAAVEVRRASDGWYADGAWLASADETAEWVRDRAAEMVVCAARNEAVAHAIEQDAAADPLLDKAQEFAALADWELTDREAELLHTVAAHVLGREVK